MTLKYMTAALMGSALLATAAVAQTPSATTDSKMNAPAATSSSTSVSGYHGDWRSSKVVGLNVYNDANEKVGSISDLLLDKSGNIKAAVIGVGGFLGVGEHLVAVPFDKLKFVETPVPSTSASTTTTTTARPGTTTGAATSTAPATTTAPAAKTNPWYPDHAVFNATKDELKSMPEFKYST
ncbi:MAG: PRC-barrel domain-containing protein [Proteobacteria bacterium]|nr:PRC-barrel domain-containing protein [Pseudomonadota bacterium]